MNRIKLFLLAGVLLLSVACTTNEGDQITNSNYYYEQSDSTTYPRFLSPSDLDTVTRPFSFTITVPTTTPIYKLQIGYQVPSSNAIWDTLYEESMGGVVEGELFHVTGPWLYYPRLITTSGDTINGYQIQLFVN